MGGVILTAVGFFVNAGLSAFSAALFVSDSGSPSMGAAVFTGFIAVYLAVLLALEVKDL